MMSKAVCLLLVLAVAASAADASKFCQLSPCFETLNTAACCLALQLIASAPAFAHSLLELQAVAFFKLQCPLQLPLQVRLQAQKLL